MVSEAVYRYLLYPTILAARGEWSTFQNLKNLRRRQWDSLDDIRERQLRALAERLASAVEHHPFYRESLQNLPSSLSWVHVNEVFRSLPFLTKTDLQESAQQLVSSSSVGRVHRKTTGGSTGQPVTVTKDSRAIAAERASSWLGYGWFGIEVGDRGARFWGSPAEPGPRRRRFDLADRAMNRIRLSAFGIDDDKLDSYWLQCLKFQPKYFYGYVSMLETFARHLMARDHDGTSLNLKCIITTSEVLGASQRRLLEETFNCPVQNEYGCGEVGPIAYECEAGSMHEMAESVFVEIIRSDGTEASAGEIGEVVVTDLCNRAMPLIRYCIEDYAVRGQACSCGRGLPVIQEIQGREYDFVRTPDGRSYHGEFFMYAIEDLRDEGYDIKRFRVIQESPTMLSVEVQTTDNRVPESLRAKLASELAGLTVDVVMLEVLEPSTSGKLRIIENRVDNLYETSHTRP